MFRTAEIQKNILILIGFIFLAYVVIFLLAPKDIADYTIADTEYWRETGNRLMLKTAYNYNTKENVQSFPKTLGDWNGMNFKKREGVYEKLNADVLLSRAYTKEDGEREIIWMDIIHSKVGESFHKQKICVEGMGWKVDNDSIVEFSIAGGSNFYTKLYANKLDISKKDHKQVMVYWFMFKKFGLNSSDAVTMIRISAPVLNNQTSTATFSSIKGFVEDQLFNAMYESALQENPTVAEYLVSRYGKLGMFAIMLIVSVPIGIVIVGIRQGRRKNKGGKYNERE